MNLARFVTAYALYAAVLLIYAYRALTDSPEALFAPSAPALTVLTATALALPIFDIRWGVLRPKRARRAIAAVFVVGLLAEVGARGSPDMADLISASMKLIMYLIVLTIALVLFSMARPRESAPEHGGISAERYTS